MNRIAVLGSGSWGTALAIQFARTGRPTIMWGIEHDEIHAMARERRNDAYLPGVPFPELLEVTTRLEEALGDAEDVLIVVPSHAFRETLQRIGDSGVAPKYVSWATKGFETASGLLPHQVAERMLDPGVPTAVISGPTFAAEVAAGLPSAVTIASADEANAKRLAKAISTTTFRAYTSPDIVGVEVGGATKNALAIGAGISDGLGFGANTRIAVVTRGLMEMTRLGLALGAQRETFMGLSGIGDLVLTCTDDQSRNPALRPEARPGRLRGRSSQGHRPGGRRLLRRQGRAARRGQARRGNAHRRADPPDHLRGNGPAGGPSPR